MSTLGRDEIFRRIRDGGLWIGPLLSSKQIGAASIDLRMGNVALIARARGASHVDPVAARRAYEARGFQKESDQQQKHERYELPFHTRFLLHPGTLALVPTLEWVSLPPDLIGLVTARSTWAREGLSIATATLIEPGYQGIITLELANLSQIPMALLPGLRIAQLALSLVEGNAQKPEASQFNLSFEPRQGDIVKEPEFPFVTTEAP